MFVHDAYSLFITIPLQTTFLPCARRIFYVLFRTKQAVAGTLHNQLEGNISVHFHRSLRQNTELLERVRARNDEMNGMPNGLGRTLMLSQVMREARSVIAMHGSPRNMVPYLTRRSSCNIKVAAVLIGNGARVPPEVRKLLPRAVQHFDHVCETACTRLEPPPGS